MKVTLSSMGTLAASLALAATPLVASAGGVQASGSVAIYSDAQTKDGLSYTALGQISEQICRKPWELPPTQADVLEALKAKARSMGANGVIAVRYDQRRLEVKGACWQRMAVAGTAVVTP